MDILLDPGDITNKHVVGVDGDTSLKTSLFTDLVDTLKVLSLVEVGNITCIQDIVDVFKLLLVDDLGIDEQESSCLIVNTTLHEAFLSIFSPVWHTISFDNLNLEAFVSSHEGGKSGQRLTTRTSNTEQQSVTHGLHNNSVDT